MSLQKVTELLGERTLCMREFDFYYMPLYFLFDSHHMHCTKKLWTKSHTNVLHVIGSNPRPLVVSPVTQVWL